ncbi:hypothetical protein M422DRAFT_37667 [Sphaerobolus stellatus SS14]|uniref:Chitin synthase export chaperone n=1 Tax=Sphaerobolus stellatus (strain SS14) TaxID=990650 RepID=A0A0C9UF04_SPHS4|nr:hypothetical protein M422DRAFT_37667 [Sphaerobolus stellatus SS14]
MSNPYLPDEDPATLFLERTFLAGDFITGVEYGIQFILYLITARYLWSYSKIRERRLLFLLGYITMLLVWETIFIVVQAITVQDIYVDHRNYPGGPWAYFLATQYKAENIIFYASLFVLTFLSDFLVLWRCWVIWSASGRGIAWAVTAFPILLLIASFVMGTLWTLQSSMPGLSLYSALPIAFGTSYYVVSVSINIILTILITIRILLHRKKLLDTLPAEHAQQYLSLMTIIIESAAIYSVTALLFIVTYAVNNPINQIFLTVASGCQQIAGYLIILRVAKGRAWGRNTTQMMTQSIKFNPSADTETAAHELTSIAFASSGQSRGPTQTIGFEIRKQPHSPNSALSLGTSEGTRTAWDSK